MADAPAAAAAPAPAAAPAAAPPVPSLLDVCAEAKGWAESLVAQLKGAACVAFALASSVCRQLVLEVHATVALLAFDGLSSAAWQRRAAKAEQVLRALRSRDAKLVLRLPTPHLAALQDVISLQREAAAVVTELVLRQQYSSAEPGTEGADTWWLNALPAAFPNLRTLRLTHLCGLLPPPALLPHLRDLDVQLCAFEKYRVRAAYPYTAEQLCESITPYLPQLTALSVGQYINHEDSQWPMHALFTTVTTTLKRFSTPSEMCTPSIQFLLQFAPNIEQLSMLTYFRQQGGSADFTEDETDATWAVKELVQSVAWEHARCIPTGVAWDAVSLAFLPHSPTGLRLSCSDGPVVHIDFEVHSPQVRVNGKHTY